EPRILSAAAKRAFSMLMDASQIQMAVRDAASVRRNQPSRDLRRNIVGATTAYNAGVSEFGDTERARKGSSIGSFLRG
ncbi:MAG: hypothetical protein KDK01_03720, partial [Rhodobacteraceae bacterium]|nr:hypothetical protein [Paracoccaceae bacterium]